MPNTTNNQLQQLITELCPDGVEYKELGEVAVFKRGTTMTKTNTVQGGVPVIAGGQKPAYYHNVSNRTGQTIVLSSSGAYAGFVSFWEIPIFLSDSFSVNPNENKLNSKYVFYFLKNLQIYIYSLKKGSGVPHVSGGDLSSIKIPLPPLPVQQEIVRILDTFTSLEAELEAELEARKQQYEYYREQLLTFGGDVKWMSLGEVCDFSQGIQIDISKQLPEREEGFVRFLRIVDFVKDNEPPRYIKDPGIRYVKKQGDLVMIRYGASAAGKVFLNFEGAIANNMFQIKINSEALQTRFLYTYLSQTKIYNELNSGGGNSTMPAITFTQIGNLKIPIPPLPEQERIVAILDQFDALTNDISIGLPAELAARRQQYEYYRNQLLSFPEYES